MSNRIVNRITRNAILLALLCLVGMFSIPLGANVRVSLQFFMVLLIVFLSSSWIDSLIVTLSYLLIGLFAPVYAGFASGITPTFGYVIGFCLASCAIFFLNKIKLPWYARMGIAGIGGLAVVYATGTIFMMVYLNWDIGTTLLVSVVPYLGFDIAKIVLAALIGHRLEEALHIRDEAPAKENEPK